MLRTLTLTLVAAATLGLAGCAAPGAGARHHGAAAAAATPAGGMAGHGGGMGAMHGMMRGRMAVATLSPTQGSSVRGLVMFHQMDGHLMVHARVSGLKPGAEHGFHVHETGSCASPDGMSAGGHFNPDGQPHGAPGGPRHAGDMPSLKADATGSADQKFMLAGPTVAAGSASVVGRAVIVHAQPDDYTTQPTGNAGARLGCGVIAGH